MYGEFGGDKGVVGGGGVVFLWEMYGEFGGERGGVEVFLWEMYGEFGGERCRLNVGAGVFTVKDMFL